MSANYEVSLSIPFGQRIATIPHEAILKLSYTLNVNAVGALTATIDREAIPDEYVVQDGQIELRRRPDGGDSQLEGYGPWLIQTNTRGSSARDGRYRRIKAETANTLLKRRHVLYYANSAQALKTDQADDLMKAIVRESYGSGANASPLYTGGVWPTRDWSARLSVDADVSAGVSTSKGFAWRNVLPLVQEIGRDAAANGGTPIYFDVVHDGSTFAFRTWLGVRGVDRSAGASLLVVSAERGSLGGTIEVSEDWTDVATAVAVGGQGQDAARVLGAAYDPVLIGQSPFGLREAFVDATQLSTVAALNAEARAELRRRRPVKVLTGDLISVPGATYGLDWGWGDRLIAEFEKESFVARVDAVTVTLERGQETIVAALRGEL